MEIVICPKSETAEWLTAKLISDRMKSKPDITLGLATGRTMEHVYAKLIAEKDDFSRVKTFNLDEYIGLDREHPQSYWRYMIEKLFAHVNIDLSNVHVPDGCAEDVKEASKQYELAIKNAGGIDVQLLGIGRTGHIGFNEPQSSFASRTRDKVLTQTTREQNKSMFEGDLDAVPERAITMGVGTILEARELILLATGKEKAKIIAQALEGPISSMVSASAVQIHPLCKIILDEDAASELTQADYHRRSFAIDPEWDAYRDLVMKS